MKEDDVHVLLEIYATKEVLQCAEIDFDKIDFALKGKKSKKFIDKYIEDQDEEYQEMDSDDLSSDQESELEDDYEVQSNNIVNKYRKTSIKRGNTTDKENKEDSANLNPDS